MLISNKNIRATALQEFWSEDHPESLYLWEGAKHNGTLTEIEGSSTPTLKDIFSTQEEIQKCHDFCKSFYYRILPELADRLNKVHNLDLPVCFWQTVFGYWLFRHISVIYEKYVYLNALDINATGIKLLSKNDFYIPQNHVDYVFCFANDFGVNQLVSQYYYQFKTKNYEVVRKEYIHGKSSSNSNAMSNRIKRQLSLLKGEPQVALLGLAMGNSTLSVLQEKSQGKINYLFLPNVKKTANQPNFTNREFIANGLIEHSFESYFMQSLHYCLPRDFLENFMEYFDTFQKDIVSRKFTHIVSEYWISDIPCAIYVALAKENKRTFICYEHAACTSFYKNYMQFIDFDAADIYLSTGWKENKLNLIQGGFACKDIIPYGQDSTNKTILYISRTNFIYGLEVNEYSATNSTYVKRLKLTADFIRLLTPLLRANLLFRPRPAELLWDVERLLELDKHNVKVDRGNFTESILQSRIVIIDHMSTGIAEILLMKVPFILVYDATLIPLSCELKKIFDDLIDCGVVHTSAQSAVSHLSTIYDDVGGWWQSESVCRPVNQLTDIFLAPASQTTDYLLSLVSTDSRSRPTLLNRFWVWAEVCARRIYRLMKKIKSLISLRTK